LSECRREKIKVLLALSEHRQEQITRPLCISKLRQAETPKCIRGGGDVTPGQVEAPEKSFSPLSELRQDETKKSGVLMILRIGKEGR